MLPSGRGGTEAQRWYAAFRLCAKWCFGHPSPDYLLNSLIIGTSEDGTGMIVLGAVGALFP